MPTDEELMSAAPGDAGETPEPNSTEEVSSSAADQHPAPESAEPVAALVPEAPVADAEVVPAPEPEPEATPEPEAAPESEPAAVEPAPEPELEPVAAAPAAEPEPVAAAPVSSMPAEPEAEPVDASDAALFEAALSALDSPDQMDSGLKRLTKGERIEATVIQVERDRVFVDLGTKSEGIVPIGELTDDNIGHASEHVKVGDKIDVIVLKTESGDGNPIVSKKRADFENAWLKIEEAFAKQTPINAPVIDRVKGGLVVDIGVRGFVPATHVGTGKLRNIDKYVGQTLECRILELDRERRKVVLSNRQAEEERRGRAKEELFDTAKPGDILSGTVRRLTDYGAFVDLGGVDGLLHISEMSWMRITHPREMFKEGQDIQVMVLRLDKDHGKISLGHRQVLPDPWNLVRENYRPNQKLTVTINRIVQAGAFVKLPEGAEAFLPLSEMSSRRLKKPQEAVSEGQEVEVQIIDLKPEDRRMVLSMRAIGGGPSMPMPQATFGDDDRDSRRLGAAGKRGKKVKGGRRQEDEDFEDYAIGRRSFGGGGGVTIGERLGMLKGFGTREDEETPEDAEAPAAASEAPEAPEAPAAESESE